MPLYEFRCPEGHDFEKFYRSIGSATPEEKCPVCGKVAVRLMSAAGLVFKGSGFYITDYGKDGKKAERDAATSAASAATAKAEKADKSDKSAKPDSAGSDAKAPAPDASAGKATGSAPATSAPAPAKTESKPAPTPVAPAKSGKDT